MKLLIAEYQSRLLYTLSVLLQERKQWEVVGLAADVDELLTLAAQRLPDVLLLDWDLLDLSQSDVVSRLRLLPGDLVIVVYGNKPEGSQRTQHLDADMLVSQINTSDDLAEVMLDCKRKLAKRRR